MIPIIKLISSAFPKTFPAKPEEAPQVEKLRGAPSPAGKTLSKNEQKELANYVAREDMIDAILFWREFWPNYGKFKLSPYGHSSLHVPNFHRKNIEKLAHEARDVDFQYSLPGRNDIKDAIINDFPLVKEYTASKIPIQHHNILVTNGAMTGIALAIEALCNPGDEVIMFEPIYPFHLGRLILRKDIKLRSVRMKYSKTKKIFEFDYEVLKKSLSDKTKVILITNPNNPTTRVFKMEEYIALSNLLANHKNCVVIEDMAYASYHEDLTCPIPYGSIQESLFEKSMTFFSCGELFNVTGLRVGFAIGGQDLLNKVAKYIPYDLHIVPSFEQMVIRDNLVSANEPYEGAKNYYEYTRKDIVKRMKRIESELGIHDIEFVVNQGTYYMVLDIEKLRTKINLKSQQLLTKAKEPVVQIDKAFCRMLFIEAFIGAFPLSCMYFGKDVPDNFVRISLNKNDADLDSLIEAMRNLDLIK